MIDNYNQVKSIISDWPFSYIYEKGASKSLGLSAKHGLSSTDRDVFFEMAKVRLTKKVELSMVPGRGIGMSGCGFQYIRHVIHCFDISQVDKISES